MTCGSPSPPGNLISNHRYPRPPPKGNDHVQSRGENRSVRIVSNRNAWNGRRVGKWRANGGKQSTSLACWILRMHLDCRAAPLIWAWSATKAPGGWDKELSAWPCSPLSLPTRPRPAGSDEATEGGSARRTDGGPAAIDGFGAVCAGWYERSRNIRQQ